MWELIILALIAVRTGKYNITSIIAWGKVSTRNGNCMIEMVDKRPIYALLKRAKAIIACVVLGFQFTDDLLHCQRTLKTSQTSATTLSVDTSLDKVQGAVSLVGLLFPLRDFIAVGIAVVRGICKLLFAVCLVVLQMLCALPSTIFLIIVLSSLIDFFTVNGQVVILLRTSLFMVPLILLSFLLFDFFGVIFTVLPLLCTYLFSMLLIVSFALFNMCIVVGFRCFVSALFATGKQPVSILVEVVRSSGKDATTRASTLLLRGIIHGLNCLSSSGLVFVCCQGGKATTLSAWVATPSLDNLYYNILFEPHQSGSGTVYCCADCGSRNIVQCEIDE